MKRFFDLTFRPFFVLTGVGTVLASLYAFWPRWAAETLAKLAFVEDYTIIVQHWGMMVGMMGVFMIAAAFRSEWRTPILIYSAVEKAFMVYLVVANVSRHTLKASGWVPRWTRRSFSTRSPISQCAASRRRRRPVLVEPLWDRKVRTL